MALESRSRLTIAAIELASLVLSLLCDIDLSREREFKNEGSDTITGTTNGGNGLRRGADH